MSSPFRLLAASRLSQARRWCSAGPKGNGKGGQEDDYEFKEYRAADDRRYDEFALQEVDNLREEIEGFGEAGKDSRDDILLYEPKPLYVVRESKQESGAMLFREFVHAASWGLPNRFRQQKGFLQRGRLQDLNGMVDKMYDIDFQELEGGIFFDYLMMLKNEPLLRPKIPSLLNPQFARTLLNYFLKQMKRLNMKRLIIYEPWGHNGQTALSILDILEAEYPHIYATCEYHMVDILGIWMTHRDAHVKAHHYDHYFEHHVSFFEWETIVPDRVFFVCLEALSYLPFDRVDVVRTGPSDADQLSIYELCMQEDIHFEDRFEYEIPLYKYSKLDTRDWYRPLQDALILEYLRHVDFGFFTKERLEQNRYHSHYAKSGMHVGEKRDHDDVREMFRFDLYNPKHTSTRHFHDMIAFYHTLGLLNNQFWIPSTQVAFFDVLRKYFPRHIFVCLDQTDLHSCLPGVNPPSVKQYVLGQAYDVKHYYLHEGMLGPTELRFNINFTHLRKLYYEMMEIPPDHPLHLRCLNLRSFFEIYGSKEVVEQLTVSKSIAQPIDGFQGGKILVAEFGADLEDIQDMPLDVAASKGHFRQRAYNRVCKYATRLGLMAEDSIWNLSTGDVELDKNQKLDTTAVRAAIGPNPTYLELDKPIGYNIAEPRTVLES